MSRNQTTGTLNRGPISKERRRNLLAFYLFISPWLLGYLIFTLGPIIASGWLSLTDYDIVNPAKFIGLDNYKEIFQSDIFWKSAWVTIYYTLGHVPLSVIGALCSAVAFPIQS